MAHIESIKVLFIPYALGGLQLVIVFSSLKIIHDEL